jgi:hypothetical protein
MLSVNSGWTVPFGFVRRGRRRCVQSTRVAGILLALVMLSKIPCSSCGAERTVSAVSVLVLLSSDELVSEGHVDPLLELLGELVCVRSSFSPVGSFFSSSFSPVGSAFWEAADSCSSSECVGWLSDVADVSSRLGDPEFWVVSAGRGVWTRNVCSICLFKLRSFNVMHWTSLDL